MNTPNAALLVNLLGFTVGIALYALLLAMVVRHRKDGKKFAFDFLLLATAVLGLLWNAGELVVFVWRDFGGSPVSPFLLAVSYSALGFLPSVVVHSAWKNSENENRNVRFLTVFAYGLSVFAALLHFQSLLFKGVAPSAFALRILTVGSLLLLAALLVFTFGQKIEKKAVWITALLIFAVSAFHLSSDAEENSFFVELVAHQSRLKNVRVPSLILQPLVENAVKHGVSKSKTGGEVSIRAELKSNGNASFLELTVSDTGAGFDEKTLTEGIGLSNVENRLKTYFGAAANLSLAKPPNGAGAVARMIFPVKKDL